MSLSSIKFKPHLTLRIHVMITARIFFLRRFIYFCLQRNTATRLHSSTRPVGASVPRPPFSSDSDVFFTPLASPPLSIGRCFFLSSPEWHCLFNFDAYQTANRAAQGRGIACAVFTETTVTIGCK